MKLIKYQFMTEISHSAVVPVERVDENGELVYEEVPVLDEHGQPVFDEEENPVTESKVVIDYEPKKEIEQIFTPCEIRCGNDVFEANYAIAQKEAHGEITVEDIPDPVIPPTTEERIAALEDALCEMDAANAANIAALEDALCEMDMGGTENE